MPLETGHIELIAVHPTASSAPPSPTSKGAVIGNTAWGTAGFTTIGSKAQKSDDMDLDAETVTLEIEPGLQPVRAPIGMAPILHRYTGSFLLPWEFVAMDVSEALVTLASNITVLSNKAYTALAVTKRTVMVEYTGQGMLYIPKAHLMMISLPAGTEGEDNIAKTTFMVFAEEGAAPYLGGFYYELFV